MKVSKDESYTIELDPTKAAQGRDAFCKAIYQRIFDHLVKRVNSSLGESMGEASHEFRFIGLLDVFGFEIFEVNSFEQLCINFANEKLHQFFLKFVFKMEEQIYTEECISGIKIEYAAAQFGAIRRNSAHCSSHSPSRSPFPLQVRRQPAVHRADREAADGHLQAARLDVQDAKGDRRASQLLEPLAILSA